MDLYSKKRKAFDFLENVKFYNYFDDLSEVENIALLIDEEDSELFKTFLPKIWVNSEKNFTQEERVVVDCRAQALSPNHVSSCVTADGVNFFTAGVFAFVGHLNRVSEIFCDKKIVKNIFVVSSPRSGSTYLTDLMTRANLGRPAEHFKSWLVSYFLITGISAKFAFTEIAKRCCSSNGIFSTKFIIDDLFEFLIYFREEIYEIFLNSQMYVLSRADKAAQSVSNLRSQKLGLWHFYEGTDVVELRKVNFCADFQEVFLKERLLARQEADCLEEFRTRKVAAKLLSYETISQSRQAARCVVAEIARGADINDCNIEGWPTLLRIGHLVSKDELLEYRAIRRNVELYSTRSEPFLGQVLGSGWDDVEHWGVRALSATVEIKIPSGEECVAVELLLQIVESGLVAIAIAGASLELDLPTQGSSEVRVVHAFEQGLPSGASVEMQLQENRTAVVEIVFYNDRRAMKSEWVAGKTVRAFSLL